MSKKIIALVMIALCVIFAGLSCEKEASEKALEIFEDQEEEIEDQEEEFESVIPEISVPENFTLKARASINKQDVIILLRVLDESYVYEVSKEPNGLKAVFHKKDIDKDGYSVYLKGLNGELLGKNDVEDFESVIQELSGLPVGVPEQPVSISPFPWYPEAKWSVTEESDNAFLFLKLDSNLALNPDIKMKIDRETGLMKTNTVLYDGFSFFYQMTEFYETSPFDYAIPNIAEEYSSDNGPVPDDFLSLGYLNIEITDEELDELEKQAAVADLPKVNVPDNFDLEIEATVNEDSMTWTYKQRTDGYMYMTTNESSGDTAVFYAFTDKDEYVAYIKDEQDTIYGETEIEDFGPRFEGTWLLPEFTGAMPFSYAPYLSSEYWICLVAEASETLTCVPKEESEDDWEMEATVSSETGLWDTVDIRNDDFNIHMEVKQMKEIKSTDILPESPYWIPNCDDEEDYYFLLLPEF